MRMNAHLQLVFYVFFFLSVIVGTIWVWKTEKRLKKFFAGKKGKDLEETIFAMQNTISVLSKAKVDAEKELSEINRKLRKSIRGLETVRFNPFHEQGGNQSFAIGMLNEDGDGVVLSSLYARERMSVFAKPIKNGKSEYELTSEEREALDRAKI